MRSKDYLYPSTRTTCRMWQISMKERSSRGDEADIYPAFEREELPRANFPFRQPTNRLENLIRAFIEKISEINCVSLPVGQ